MPNNPDTFYSRVRKLIQQGPWLLTRRPIPQPGSENIIFVTWALPKESPIDGAIPNHRTFQFQEPLVVPNHLIGLTSQGGYTVPYPYYSAPLTEVQPNAQQPTEIVIYG